MVVRAMPALGFAVAEAEVVAEADVVALVTENGEADVVVEACETSRG